MKLSTEEICKVVLSLRTELNNQKIKTAKVEQEKVRLLIVFSVFTIVI